MNTPFTRTVARAAAAAALAWMPGAGFALDLMGAYDAALRVDPTLLAARQAVLAGSEKAVQGNALILPQVSFSASLTRTENQSSTALPEPFSELIQQDSAGTVHELGVQLKQPIYDAQAWSDRTQMHRQTDIAEIRFRDAQQALIEDVGEAYFELLLAQQTMSVTLAEKETVGTQLERAKARYDVGRSKITDLQEAQARYDSVLAKEVSAQATLAMKQAQYRELVGERPDGLADLRADFVPVPPLPDSLEAWQAKGLDHNTRVQMKQGELAIARAEIDKYRLSARPTLDFVAGYTDTGQDGGLSEAIAPDGSRSTSVGLQLSIPLFAGGAIGSRYRESIAKMREAEQDLNAARRDARLQVQDAYLAVKTGVARIAALVQSVKSAQTALEATVLGRDVGTRTEPDVLDAQQHLFSSQLELAQARNEYLLGRIRLASAAGELGESDLQALNAYLAH